MFGFSRDRRASNKGPDFSDVDSLGKAEALFHRGKLEKLYLMPLEFGGDERPANTLFVPVGIARLKWGIDNNVIGPSVAAGKLTKYSAKPKYQGSSFIPISIEIVASEPRDFKTVINIWGDALQQA